MVGKQPVIKQGLAVNAHVEIIALTQLGELSKIIFLYNNIFYKLTPLKTYLLHI